MKNIINISLILLSLNIYSQHLRSFDELLNYGYEHHPDMKNSSLRIKKEKLMKNEIGTFQPLELMYQGGQNNALPFDNQISVNQDITPLLLMNNQKQKADNDILLSENQHQLIKFQYRLELQKLYQNYLYQKEIYNEWKQLENKFEYIVSKMKLQYEEGEIDRVQYVFIKNELLTISKNKTLTEIESQMLKSEITKFCYLSDTTFIPDESLKKLNINTLHKESLSSTIIKSYELEQNSKELELKVIKRQNSIPNFSIGGFTQSIEAEWMFSGFNVGLAIQIDKRAQKSQMQQIEIDKQLIQNDYKIVKNLISEKNNISENNLFKLDELINKYNQEFMSENDKQLDRISQQLIYGEIDFTTFSKYYQNIQEIKMDYWGLIKDYNINLIEYEYYSN